MHEVDPVLAGVNHFPLATELRVRGADAFPRLRAILADPEQAAIDAIWMDPPERAQWTKITPADYWTKLDVIANNRVRFEVFSRFGVLPGSGDHHSVEFMPNVVHAGNDFGTGWRVHHYGMPGHRRDADDDVAYYEEMRGAPDVPRMPSGELVAALLDAMVTGARRDLPVNLPNAGNVENLPDGAVVEITGTADGDGVRGRDTTTVPGIMGEYLRRVHTAQEWTVEAALTGDRDLVLEAMLADVVATQASYDDVVAMTGEMLTATSRWLPQFS
jgi:alpha-galactosidase